MITANIVQYYKLHMTNPHIEVVASDIPSVATKGLGALAACHNVYNALSLKYDYVVFNIIRRISDLAAIICRKPDLVFSGIRYLHVHNAVFQANGNGSVWISEYMGKAGVNYTGSSRQSLEVERNKYLAKKKVEACGIKTISYFLHCPHQFHSSNQLPLQFPLFIKPVNESDSWGIGEDSVVYDFEQYTAKVNNINQKFQQSPLVEQFITGREFTVAILDFQPHGELVAMPVEIIVPKTELGHRILDYHTKKKNQERVIPIGDQTIFTQVATLAKQAFMALDGRDFGRIDILMDDQGCLYFLEANFMPGMTQRESDIDCSYFPRACFINTGMTYHETVCTIADIAMSREMINTPQP